MRHPFTHFRDEDAPAGVSVVPVMHFYKDIYGVYVNGEWAANVGVNGFTTYNGHDPDAVARLVELIRTNIETRRAANRAHLQEITS